MHDRDGLAEVTAVVVVGALVTGEDDAEPVGPVVPELAPDVPSVGVGLSVALSVGLVIGALGYGALSRRLRRRPVVITSLTLASVALAGLAAPLLV